MSRVPQLGVLLFIGTGLFPTVASAQSPAPVPLTRPEMKKLLEESKRDVPRLTPPPPTPEQIAAAQERKTPFTGTYRIRYLLPPELRGGYFFLMDGRTLEMDIRALS